MLTFLAPYAFFLSIRFTIFFPASSSILSDTAKDFYIAGATLATLERYEQAFHAFERATQFAPNNLRRSLATISPCVTVFLRFLLV